MSFFNPLTPGQVFGKLVDRVAHRDQAPTTSEYVLQLHDVADLSAARALPRGADRKAAAWDALQATARASQAPITPLLDEWKAAGAVASYRGNALVNEIAVQVPADQRAAFEAKAAQLPGVERLIGTIAEEAKASVASPAPGRGFEFDAAPQTPKVTPPASVVVPGTEPLIDGVSWGVKQIHADEAWKQGIDGTGIVVGVVDTGVNPNHPALQAALEPKRGGGISPGVDQVDPEIHGTHVSGSIVGAAAGFATGVAPGAGLRVANFHDKDFFGAVEWLVAPGTTDAVNGARDARHGVDILSNSWGFSGIEATNTPLISRMHRMIDAVDGAGIVQVYAAGNEGPGPNTLGYPAAEPQVIAVAASDRTGQVASFSSRGSSVLEGGKTGPDITAPGAAVPSSMPPGVVNGELAGSVLVSKLLGVVSAGPVSHTNGAYWMLDGTSMAAPHIAGVAALLLQKYPQITPEQVREAIMASGVDVDAPGFDTTAGAGIVDVPAALAAAGRLAAQ